MTAKYEDIDGEDTVTFSSGRAIKPNLGIVGIGPDGDVTEGYDNGLMLELTADERCELADLMITRWTAFKTATKTSGVI